MRILHLLGAQNLPKKPDEEASSGIVRVALEVARRQAASGHRVAVAVANRSSWTSGWNGVRLIGLRSIPWARFKYGAKWYDFSLHLPYVLYTRLNKIDIIHAHGYSYLRFLRAKGKVVHLHGDPFYRGSGDRILDPEPADFRVLSFHSDAQIAVSHFVGRELSRGLEGRGKVHIIYNGVECARFSSEHLKSARASLRAEWNLPQNGIIILYSGAVTKEKGVIHLARAFHNLALDSPNLYLVVAGSGKLWGNELAQGNWQTAYEEEVRSFLQPHLDSGRVLFLGKIPFKDMPSIYSASDMMVVPSIWKEAFPLAALEAMAASLPIVASRTGGLVEIVDNQTGILVEPGDDAGLEAAILRLSLDSELRNCMARNARQKAENFTWESTVHSIEQLYLNVLARN